MSTYFITHRLLHTDSETSARIGELLADVNEKANFIEELQSQLNTAQSMAKEKEDMIQGLRNKVTTFEKLGPSSDELCGAGSGVPAGLAIHQVETMEQLFTETVGQLETRVKQLEGSSAPSSLMSNSVTYNNNGNAGGRVRSHPTSTTKPAGSGANRWPAAPAAAPSLGASRQPLWATKRPAAGHNPTTSTRYHGSNHPASGRHSHARSSSINSTMSSTSSRYVSGGRNVSHTSMVSMNVAAAAGGGSTSSTFGGRARIEPGRLRAKSWGSGGGGSSFGIGGGRYHRPAFQL